MKKEAFVMGKFELWLNEIRPEVVLTEAGLAQSGCSSGEVLKLVRYDEEEGIVYFVNTCSGEFFQVNPSQVVDFETRKGAFCQANYHSNLGMYQLIQRLASDMTFRQNLCCNMTRDGAAFLWYYRPDYVTKLMNGEVLFRVLSDERFCYSAVHYDYHIGRMETPRKNVGGIKGFSETGRKCHGFDNGYIIQVASTTSGGIISGFDAPESAFDVPLKPGQISLALEKDKLKARGLLCRYDFFGENQEN